MKIKKEYLILALIIAGLVAYLYMRKEDRSLYELPVLPEVSKKEISKIEISKHDTRIELNKKDETWHIAPRDFPADKELVKAMLAEIETLTVTTLVSESGDYQRYDLGDDKKIAVKVWGGEKLLRNFEVGKAASSFRHTFVKLANDERVYHARNSFRNTFDKTMDDLRDKAVLGFQSSDISELQIANEKTSLTLTRAELSADESQAQTDQSTAAASKPAVKDWQSAEGKTGNQDNINRLLSAISNLRCESFIDDRQKQDFTGPIYSIDLKGVQNHKLSIFAKLTPEGTNYPATSTGSDYAFLLSEDTADRIMKNPGDLLEKPKTEENKAEAEKSEPE